MPEAVKEYRQWRDKYIQTGVWPLLIIAGIGKQILWRLFGMPRPLAFVLAYLLAIFVTYDYFPNPRLGFTKYAVSMSSVVIGGALAFFVAIPYLEGFMHPVLAYAIPLLSYAVVLSFIFTSFSQDKGLQKNS
jgi:hypothetical protein